MYAGYFRQLTRNRLQDNFWVAAYLIKKYPNMIQNCIPEFLDTGRKCWTLYSGCWTPDAGLWALDSGCWTLDARLSTLDSRRWALYTGHCFTASERWTLFHLPVSEQNQNPVSGSA